MGSFKADDKPKSGEFLDTCEHNVEFNWAVNEISWTANAPSDLLTRTREDVKADRLSMPGKGGPRWSACTRGITQDVGSLKIAEDRSVEDTKGSETRR